ncbi:MAG: alpha/beta hydrolase [Proteobacteria bacterium]|nr:alpha/beta hydrolase [Pseudomonadota bacterium]MDA1356043.1 alpha/beta hydrolase [Pseudomonadota bacterium]
MMRRLFRRKSVAATPLRPGLITGRNELNADESPALRVRADGHLVRAVSYGKGPRFGPTIVFLHEGLGSIAQWKHFPDTLARAAGCNALVYERWGHGDSDPLDGPRQADFMEREAVSVLPQILDSFGLDKVILFGHSDGGSIALLFAARYPERTLGVITEAAHVFVEEVSLAGVRAAVERFETSDMEKRLRLYHGDNVARMFSGWADIWLSAEFRDWSIPSETLGAIQAPVLALQGADDEYGSAAQLQRIEAGIGAAAKTVLIPDCAHEPHVQAREAVMDETLGFIEIIKAALAPPDSAV